MKLPGVLVLAMAAMPLLGVADQQPPALKSEHHPGLTLYVSKLGDDSDGRSWRTAFRTIQAALNAVPDDLGGHRVIIRPDTYAEANLDSKHKGARRRLQYDRRRLGWQPRLGRARLGGN